MKKFAFLMLTFLFSSVALAQPMRFEQGKHYEVISQTADSKPNVTEYFSFYCPHCYKFEFIAKELEKNIPAGAKFVKSHVDFLRAAKPEIQHMLTRAMVVADKMGIKEQVVSAIFNQIHQERKPFLDEAGVLAIFDKVGGDKGKAEKMMDSFAIKGEANRMKKAQDDLSRARVLNSVPMIIVNGKYKINSKELRSMDDYQSLVEFLLQLK